MAVLDKIRAWRRKADDPPIINNAQPNRPSIYVRGSGLPQASWTTMGDYHSAVRNGYQTNADVYACVSLIAQAGKQVKWEDVPVGADGTPTNVRVNAQKRGPSQMLLERAGGPAFIDAWLSYMLLAGEGFTRIVADPARIRDQPSIWSVELLRPDRMRYEVNRNLLNQPISMWFYTPYGVTPQPIPPKEMWHAKLFNPVDDYRGMAPLQAAMGEVDTRNEGKDLMKRVLQRGYVPGWIEADPDIDWQENDRAALKAAVKHAKATGEELFLTGAKWHPMGFDLGDSGINESRVLTKRDIAAVFHVPPELIGDSESKTYSNYHEARQALYTEAVIPLLTQFRDGWNRQIGLQLGSFLGFDKDSFDALTLSRAQNTERVVKTFTTGLITQDEARLELRYDPVETLKPTKGNQFYAPMSFVPMATEPEEPEPEETETAE